MRKHHDDQRYCAKAEMEKQSLLRLIVVACVRPICTFGAPTLYFSWSADVDMPADFLLTEPIVQCFSVRAPKRSSYHLFTPRSYQLWLGFTWGVLLALIEYVISFTHKVHVY